MRALTWSSRAAGDLGRLYDFLASKDGAAARRAIQAIRDGTRILRQRPEVGRSIAGLPRDVRDWSVKFGQSGYVVRYRFSADEVAVLAVRHMREEGFGP